MSTAGQPDALARRIEALVAAAPDSDAPSLVVLVEALRAEVGALRAELGQVRAEGGTVRSHLDDVRSALPALTREVRSGVERDGGGAAAALAEVREAVEPRLGVLADDLETLAERVEALGRDGAATAGDALVAVREALEPRLTALHDLLTAAPGSAGLDDLRTALEPRLAVLEEALGGLAERVEALARDGASTTIALLQSLQAKVEGLDRRLAESGSASAAVLERLAAVEERAAQDREQAARDRATALEQASRDRAAALEQAARDRAAAEELAATVRAAVDRLAALATVVPPQAEPADDGSSPAAPPPSAGGEEVLQTVRAAVGGVHAGLEQVRGELAAAVSALTGELASSVTGQERSVEQLRDEVLARLQEQHETVVASLRAAAAEVTGSHAEVGQRLGVLTAVSDEVGQSVAAISAEISAATAEMAAELRARADEEGAQSAGRLLALDEQVRAQLTHARESWDERAQELGATLARGLSEIAEEVDIAATTTRDSSHRVTVLTELAEVQRTEVAQLLRSVADDVVAATSELRTELLARTAEQLGSLETSLDALGTTVGVGTDELGGRLDDVAGRVAQSRAAVDQVAHRLDELVAAAGRLDGTVNGFRDEWPTRTYEVVEGARAVAEAVVLDVREEVSARLADVRTSLEQALGTMSGARADLDDGTDRLARAGAVLVAYLEHRDRLLEAERDHVLHEVLDAFAAGLSARERSALAGRVSDAVTRRKDARDAERYREALGEPVAPTAELPDDVRELAARGDAARQDEQQAPGERLDPPSGPGQGPPVDAESGKEQPVEQRAAPAVAHLTAPGGRAVVPGPGRRTGAPGRAPLRPAPDGRAADGPSAGRPLPTGRGTTVRPAPGRPTSPATATASAPERSVPGPGRSRGRLGAMPQSPNVDVALEAAAPSDDLDR